MNNQNNNQMNNHKSNQNNQSVQKTSMLGRHFDRFGKLWILVMLLAAGACFVKAAPSTLWGSSDGSGKGSASANVRVGAIDGKPLAYKLKAIEQIQVGQRVLAHNPEVTDEERELAEEIDPPTWRKITLQMTKPDGSLLDIVFLRPVEWIEDEGAKVGGTIDLDMGELGATGEARVIEIAPCPPIQAGKSGQVVTGTYCHQRADVLDLQLEDQPDPIGVTSNHPFWSEDQNKFVPAGELKLGERLASLNGTTRVAKITHRATPERVYNLEVDVEDVFYVSSTGMLVHNYNLFRPLFLPSAKKITIDIAHIVSGHTKKGVRYLQSLKNGTPKDVFPDEWSAQQIASHVRNAYKNAVRTGSTQAKGAFKMQGRSGGLIIEIWFNRITKEIKSAYPIGKYAI